MKLKKIYTLEWIKDEALLISGYWNGGDEKYIDGNGETRTEEDASAASELLDKIQEVEALIEELGI
jgi:hypothetical protein